MTASWDLRVFENRQSVFEATVSGALELGRQDRGEEAPYSLKLDTHHTRLILARLDEDRIPRKYARLEPRAGGGVAVTNLSNMVPLRLENGSVVSPGATLDVNLPLVLLLGSRAVRIETPGAAEDLLRLPEATVPPFRLRPDSARLATLPTDVVHEESFIRWLQTAMGVLQSAVTSLDFFPQAARAVVDLVGLDSCRVLLRDKGSWRVQAIESSAVVKGEVDWQPSGRILDRVLQEKRTLWELPTGTSLSLVGVKALVAAPILDRQGEVIGVLYGDCVGKSSDLCSITRLQAVLVELLAGGVAAGLARVEQEQAALRTQVQHEQFFTPELSRVLREQPELLEGRIEEVSVLFCDIRGFSRISERLGPAPTIEWTGHVLGALSECVRDTQGVLVDYVGDELMAMWGAPWPQPDHAQRACRAALDMVARLPQLNQRWQETLKEPMSLTIGINTGPACVGQIGSQWKFKYGPRGTTVNVASRVQGVNKHLKTSILMTEHTHGHIQGAFPTRRLCLVRLVNIAEPVTVFELAPQGEPRWHELQSAYENALGMFEHKQFREAARVLGKLLPEFANDGPSLVLMSRTVQGLVEPDAFEPVWQLQVK
jgi:adenylate cyclase